MRFPGYQRRSPDPKVLSAVRAVFLGPVEIAGYFARLRRGFGTLGITTMYVDLTDHPFSYPEAPVPGVIVRVANVASRRSTAGASRPLRAAWKAVDIAARAVLLIWAIVRCDVFVFGFGQTLFGLRELGLLRLLRKRLIFVFFGTDARPSYLDGIDANQPNITSEDLIALTKQKRSRIRVMERYAHVIVSHGPASQLFSRSYASWIDVGIPTIPQESRESRSNGLVRVVHAPSHAVAKGTSLIRSAIESLAADGVEIDYREVQGAPNSVVRDMIEGADIVVDQLYADTPMAVLASEAAAAGKPVIVGSLDWPAATAGIDMDSLPPTIRCSPETVGEALRELVESTEIRETMGRQAQDFVLRRWAPELVARRYVALADGSAPAEWFRSPESIRYIAGCGLTREQLRRHLRNVARLGVAAFCIEGNPALETLLLQAAAQEPNAGDT